MQQSACKSPNTHVVLDPEDRENTGERYEDSPRVPLADKKMLSQLAHSSKYKEVVERTIVRMDTEQKVERAHQRLIAERQIKDQYRLVAGATLPFLESLYMGSDLDSTEGICRRLLLVRLGDLDDQPQSDEVKRAQKMLWKEALQLMVKYEL